MSLRIAGRLAQASCRTSRLVISPSTILRTPLARSALLKPSTFSAYSHAQFSTSRQLRANEELVAKLESEISIGKEEQEQQEQDFGRNIKEFLENSEFQLQDTPGHEEVTLTRKYNDETIKVVFSIADFGAEDADNELDDSALYDEDVDASSDAVNAQSGGANTKGSVSQGRTRGGNIQIAPDDDVTPADREELREDQQDDMGEPGFPANVQVHVTRPGKGALTFSCVVEEGNMQITDVFHFPRAEMAEAKTPETDLARRSIYTGPEFGNLDENLQDIFETYLEERGINEQMAIFIPDYIDTKEQREYIRWLNDVKTFVE